MNSTVEKGNFGEELVYRKLRENGISCVRLPYGQYGDMITDSGVLIDVKYASFPVEKERGWRFSAIHDGHKQEEVDIFVCVAEIPDKEPIVLIFPGEYMENWGISIPKGSIKSGKYDIFRENWDIIRKRSPKNDWSIKKFEPPKPKEVYPLEYEEDEVLLTTTEAAARLNISPITVRTLCQRGEIRAQKVGRDWLIFAHDLTRYSPRPVGRPKKGE